MIHPNEISDISLEESMKQQVDKMTLIYCHKNDHESMLEKLCVDDDCNIETEQFDLECEECEDI